MFKLRFEYPKKEEAERAREDFATLFGNLKKRNANDVEVTPVEPRYAKRYDKIKHVKPSKEPAGYRFFIIFHTVELEPHCREAMTIWTHRDEHASAAVNTLPFNVSHSHVSARPFFD